LIANAKQIGSQDRTQIVDVSRHARFQSAQPARLPPRGIFFPLYY
jgi:hypothetical protein